MLTLTIFLSHPPLPHTYSEADFADCDALRAAVLQVQRLGLLAERPTHVAAWGNPSVSIDDWVEILHTNSTAWNASDVSGKHSF